MNSAKCHHLIEYKRKNGVKPYRSFYQHCIICITDTDIRVKVREVVCSSCKEQMSRPHACLFCTFRGCSQARHIHEHAKAKNHPLAVDLVYGKIVCFICVDYQRDKEFEAIARTTELHAASRGLIPKRYHPREPIEDEVELNKRNPKRRKVEEDSTNGLRGLDNLGNTCWMSSVVQALTHTPSLRDYFLSGQHNCLSSSSCVACEVGRIFQEVSVNLVNQSGKKLPL